MATTDSHLTADHLRHMTSSTALTKDHRSSQRFSLRMSPARSPTSIPSSPTSVHSSSSAIFERDIEPLSPPSPQPHHQPNPHRIPRSKTTEQLEHSVPSVLDSAAAILAGIPPDDESHQSDQITVVSPASLLPNSSSSFGGSGFASPIGSFRSRSPSPTIGSLAGAAATNHNHNHNRASLLLNIPSPASTSPPPVQGGTNPATAPVPAPASPPLRINTAAAGPEGSPNPPPSVITPTSAYFTTASGSDAGSEPGSPTTATTAEHPASPPHQPSFPAVPHTPRASSSSPPPYASTSPHTMSVAPLPPTNHPTHAPYPTPSTHTPYPHPPNNNNSPPHSPPQPSNQLSKRLSFISYSDLLASAPTSTLPLSQLTTSASCVEPPPHIPGVTGLVGVGHGHGHGFGSGMVGGVAGLPGGSPSPSLRGFVVGASVGAGAGIGAGVGAGAGGAGMMDEGGEWEREGLGRGLEERLDWVR